MAETDVAGWLLPGTWVSITLPEHFTFAGMPTVLPLLGVPDLMLGPAFLEDGNRTLSVFVSFNGRIEPLQGMRVTDVFVAYDGVGIPFEYRGSITGTMDLTEVADPSAIIDSGIVSAAVYAGTVLDVGALPVVRRVRRRRRVRGLRVARGCA